MQVHSVNDSEISVSSRGYQRLSINNANNSLLAENDDEREKIMRRQSRLKSTSLMINNEPKASMDQILAIYSACIKLSSENKITKQNAFGLRLIDYMQEVIVHMKEDKEASFQTAGSTIDASIKIYGHRVDSVHFEAFNVAETIDGKSENDSSTIQQSDIDTGALEDQAAVKSSKPTKQIERQACRSKIETNLTNIRHERFESEEEWNLWNVAFARRPILSIFGRRGPDAYIVNNYNIDQDFGVIIIDYCNKPSSPNNALIEAPVEFPSSILDSISSIDENTKLTGIADDFSFKSWVKPQETKLNNSKNLIKMVLKSDTTNTISQPDDDDDPNENRPLSSVIYPEIEVSYDEQNFDYPSVSQSRNVFETEQPPLNRSNSFNLPLAFKPSDYSYFDHAFTLQSKTLENANSNKFNFLARSKNKILLADKKSTKRNNKDLVKEDFLSDLPEEDKNALLITKKSKKLNQTQTIHKLTNFEVTTLPLVDDNDNCENNYDYEDDCMHDPRYNLLFLFTHSKMCLNVLSGKIQLMDLDQPQAVLPLPTEANADYDSQDDVNAFFAEMNEISHSVNKSVVQRPALFDALLLNFDKMGKRVNTKILKSTMWSVIESNNDNKKDSHNQLGFSSLHGQLVEVLPPKTAKNLSPQISFLCLLHLANEKQFSLVNHEDNYSVDIVFNHN